MGKDQVTNEEVAAQGGEESGAAHFGAEPAGLALAPGSPVKVSVIAVGLKDFAMTQKFLGVLLEIKGRLLAVVPHEAGGVAYFYYTGLSDAVAAAFGFQPG